MSQSNALLRAQPDGATNRDSDATSQTRRRVSRKPFVAVGAAAALAIGWGTISHVRVAGEAQQTQQASRDRTPVLRVAPAELRAGPVKLRVPGQTLAFESARLFARATGYIAERRVDIGSRVKKGDLLALISAPDLDHQLAQARAQLVQYNAQTAQARAQVEVSRANSTLANVTYGRTKTLADKGWETLQNLDTNYASTQTQQANVANAQAGVAVAEANAKAQEATVERLKQLTEFERVVAPFDGVITSRNIEIGDLVNADSAGASMFSIARDDLLRIQSYVPQSNAIDLHSGIEARVTLPETPDRQWPGHIARDAVALDASSRSLLVEVDVPNENHELRPGLFVNVELLTPRATPGVIVPAEAIVFNKAGLRVATVDADNRIRFRQIVIARDFGSEAEVTGGLSGGERIVLNPPADLKEGQLARLPDVAPPAAGKVSQR